MNTSRSATCKHYTKAEECFFDGLIMDIYNISLDLFHIYNISLKSFHIKSTLFSKYQTSKKSGKQIN